MSARPRATHGIEAVVSGEVRLPIVGDGKPVDFVVVTALPKELAPLLKLLGAHPLPKFEDDAHQYYGCTIETRSGGLYETRLLCAGDMGGTLTTAAVIDAINLWHPRYVIMAGIAATPPGGGRTFGAVLVAKSIVDASQWKVFPTTIEVRDSTYNCDFELISAVEHLLIEQPRVRAHLGRIVSQTHLVKSAKFRDWLVRDMPRVVGIEMEGGGLGAAIATRVAGVRPGLIMIKGAVDFANYRKNDSAQRRGALKSSSIRPSPTPG